VRCLLLRGDLAAERCERGLAGRDGRVVERDDTICVNLATLRAVRGGGKGEGGRKENELYITTK